jgi:ribosomal protein L24
MIKHGDKVRVKEGFYEGCEGVAVDIFYYPIEQIEVEIATVLSTGCYIRKTKIFSECNLEKIEE